ncbi:MAG TPA: hypothetical protein VM686_35500 [Polyangiaceae bacterium]|nr:hypothetical protein [Polyangiaceae bacterium]
MRGGIPVSFSPGGGFGRGAIGLGLALALLSSRAGGQALRDTAADSWEATDGLGRSLPTDEEVGPPQPRQVLMFYYIWHQRSGSDGPYDLTKITAGKQQPFSDADFGPSPLFHHWGEPALGYYDINDEFVLRRHAQMLHDAGVDAVILDVTNAATYDATWKTLCSVYADLRANGNPTPAIAFLANSSSDATVQHLYDELYAKQECQGLWFTVQGKPLMMAARGGGLSAAAQDFFTFRQSWAWTDPNGWFADGQDKWPWLDNHPQKWGWHSSADEPEEMPVGVAQHPTGNYGRSYHAGQQPALDANYVTADTAAGLGFQEQWDRVHEVKPPVVLVTQWNEWIAQRFVKCGQYDTGATHFMGRELACGDSHFIDDFNQEFSRDIEPMRGGHEDAYYYQLVANVRRYKGARPGAEASPAGSFGALTASAFDDVTPDYLDDLGDVTHRNMLGYGGPEPYVNSSGRNDFDLVRVGRDDTTLYFYARTSSPLTPSSDERWMVLWLDSDGDSSTGFMGFDHVVNRTRQGSSASVEAHVGPDFTWQAAGDAELVATGSELVLAVPRAAVALPATAGALSFRFKWTDNVPEPLTALELIEQGDSAPNGRFTYRYQTSSDVPPGGTGGSSGGSAGGESGGMSGGSSVGGSPGSSGAGLRAGGTGYPVTASSGAAPRSSGCSCRSANGGAGGLAYAGLLLALVLLRTRR